MNFVLDRPFQVCLLQPAIIKVERYYYFFNKHFKNIDNLQAWNEYKCNILC